MKEISSKAVTKIGVILAVYLMVSFMALGYFIGQRGERSLYENLATQNSALLLMKARTEEMINRADVTPQFRQTFFSLGFDGVKLVPEEKPINPEK